MVQYKCSPLVSKIPPNSQVPKLNIGTSDISGRKEGGWGKGGCLGAKRENMPEWK